MSPLGINENIKTNNPKSDVIASLDIGTSKICVVICAQDDKPRSLKILGIGITESEGVKGGVIVNIEKAVTAIKKAIQQAEQQSGIKIKEVVIGIAGDHIESTQTRCIVAITNPNEEITYSDVERLLEDAKKISLPMERKIIHVIPQDYIIDGQDGIQDPIGMSGVRMEANVHIVTGLATAIQNIYKSAERLNIQVKDIVLQSIASSCAVLSEEEKEVGVALIDIGGGTSDIAIYEDNILRWTSTFSVAGKHVTDDIRYGLGVILSQAERVKKEYGHACISSISSDEVFMIPGISGRKPLELTKSILCQIIEPRMEEIFEIAYNAIRKSGYSNKLGAGIVLTGGSSLLKGTDELASQVFGMPVKIGIPAGFIYTGLGPEIENPIYSTAVGLALYSIKESSDKKVNKNNIQKPIKKNDKKISIFKKMKKFIEEL